MKTIKHRILVTAVGGDLGISVVKCLKDSDLDAWIIGCDINPYAPGQLVTNQFLQAPPVKQEKEYTDFILKTVEREKIDVVFPLSDLEINFIHRNRKRFSACNAHFAINDDEVIETFMDKYRTIEFFKANRITCPETWLPEEYRGQGGFPLILKKRRGSGSVGLVKINDREELDFHLKRTKNMVLQQYLPGEDNEYTSTIFIEGKKRYYITFKRKLAAGGYSNHVELVTDQRVTPFLDKIADAITYKGCSINVQFRIVDDVCMPFEINPRFSSTVFFRHKFGFKDVLWTLDMLEGKPIRYTLRSKRAVGIKTFDEVFFNLEDDK